jgi:hypothetical protein
MGQATKKGKHHNLQRSYREAPRNAMMRPQKIRNARANHLKRAKQSCGAMFAEKLSLYYATHPAPESRH